MKNTPALSFVNHQMIIILFYYTFIGEKYTDNKITVDSSRVCVAVCDKKRRAALINSSQQHAPDIQCNDYNESKYLEFILCPFFRLLHYLNCPGLD